MENTCVCISAPRIIHNTCSAYLYISHCLCINMKNIYIGTDVKNIPIREHTHIQNYMYIQRHSHPHLPLLFVYLNIHTPIHTYLYRAMYIMGMYIKGYTHCIPKCVHTYL